MKTLEEHISFLSTPEQGRQRHKKLASREPLISSLKLILALSALMGGILRCWSWMWAGTLLKYKRGDGTLSTSSWQIFWHLKKDQQFVRFPFILVSFLSTYQQLVTESRSGVMFVFSRLMILISFFYKKSFQWWIICFTFGQQKPAWVAR